MSKILLIIVKVYSNVFFKKLLKNLIFLKKKLLKNLVFLKKFANYLVNMLYFIVLLFLVSSHFYPAEKPASFETNECPISIDETLKYLAPNQYSGCKYPKSKVYIEDTIYKIPRYCFYGVVLRELILNNHVEIIEEGEFERAANLRIIEECSFYQAITTDTIIFHHF